MSYDIPILFLVFNRPDTTKKVFAKIKSMKPKKLYIAADGPRENNLNDLEKNIEVKKIVSKIDWDCKVKILYRNKNLGCKLAVSSAITWFFKNEEMGIILEDDCLPNTSFFKYCKELLVKYKDDDRIMILSGNTFINDKIRNKYIKSDYFFSKYPHIWGWASWRRAWNKYDINMTNYDEFKKNKYFKLINNRFLDRLYWRYIFNLVKNNKINTWDYQWQYSIWVNNGLSIQPKYDLVKNIGFGNDSTHTINSVKQDNRSLNISIHPFIFLRNIYVDNFISKNSHDISLFKLILKFLKIF